MGFLEWIFGRRKEETVQEKKDYEELNMDSVGALLSKKFEEKFEPFKKDANKIYQELQSATDNIEKSLNELAEAKFTDQVDPELLQNVTAHRKSFIQKMEFMRKHLKIQMQPDFDSILNYSQSISQTISETNQNTVNDYRFVDRLFEKEGEQVINDFKVIGKLSDDLKNLIKSDKDNLLSIKNMQNDFESVKKEICILHEMEENLEILDEKISNLKSEHEKENEEIKKLESGKDWSDLNELLEKKKRIMDEISKLKSELIQNISKIERPLRKLKNMVDKGSVDIDNEKLLEKYVDSFLGKVIEDKNSEEINSILKTIQKNISEGKIETKDDEVKNILENDVFGNILKKYSALENDQKELEERIDENIGLKRRNEMEDNIKDLEKQMEISNSEIEKIKKQIDKIKGSVDEKKILLEKSIGEVENKKIRLV
jgi:chromosome segregation ATPase